MSAVPEGPGSASGYSAISSGRSLNPFVKVENGALHAMGPSKWTLVDVIADSGACETVMPASMLGNIVIRSSAVSLAKVEYEVASGKAVPIC